MPSLYESSIKVSYVDLLFIEMYGNSVLISPKKYFATGCDFYLITLYFFLYTLCMFDILEFDPPTPYS